jgi:MFS transporter, PAT family, beta-lactamase induction signal transducer AmpG
MQPKLPLWVMGVANAPYGAVSGFLTTAIPILLRAQGVSVAEIASIVAIGISPLFWIFILSPILDVHFSKKTYAILFAALAAACIFLSVFFLHDLRILTILLVAAYSATTLYHYALFSWLTQIMEEHHYAPIASICEITNLGAVGVFGAISVWLIHSFSAPIAGLALAAVFLLTPALLLLFPAAAVPTRRAKAVFNTFFRDLYTLLNQRRCRYALLIFLAPICSFALPFSAVGPEFHTTERWMTLINGPGASIACGLGCILAIFISRYVTPRMSYILTGLVAAMVTGAMMPAARTMAVFIVGRLLYSVLQGVNFTVFSALLYQIVGKNNPLAGTQLSLLNAASCLPIVYMTKLDGIGFKHGGMNGMLAMDTFVAIATCIPILLFFHHVHRTGREATPQPLPALGQLRI